VSHISSADVASTEGDPHELELLAHGRDQ